jgi:hypothetical protein
MLKDLVLKLKFLGVIPQAGYYEYGFRVEAEDENPRLVILTIENAFFRDSDLMVQEAPDLCYQKILMDLEKETSGSPIPSRIPVTASDIAQYRDLHPTAKLRKRA